MKQKRVSLYTYYKGSLRLKQTTMFTVPFEWLESYTIDMFNQTVDEFLDTYTYDDSERIKDLAIKGRVFSYTK